MKGRHSILAAAALAALWGAQLSAPQPREPEPDPEPDTGIETRQQRRARERKEALRRK